MIYFPDLRRCGSCLRFGQPLWAVVDSHDSWGACVGPFAITLGQGGGGDRELLSKQLLSSHAGLLFL